MMSHINIFDAVVIGIMALSCLFAFFRGLVAEVLSLAAWVGAAIVTGMYFHTVAEKLTPHFRDPRIAVGAAILMLYIGALVAFSLVNRIIIKTIRSGEGGGMLDSLLGLAFGALRGALIISLGYFLLTKAMAQHEKPEWLEGSKTQPYAQRGADTLAKLAPEFLSDISSFEENAQQQVTGGATAAPQEQHDVGYSQSATQQLNRLIQGNGQ